MIRLVTIIGARPQIIKAAAISRAIRNSYADQIKEIIVHTGQHYDDNMSAVFMNELGVPKEDYNLQIGSSSHGDQTAGMLKGIEDILQKEKPDALVIYGDTNSTLAGGIAASKIHIPVIHVEAGLRSFNKKMPEEINRICCDHVSTLLFTPTLAGIKNLQKEGFKLNTKAPYSIDNPKVYHCGDVMYDNSLYFKAIAEKKSDILERNKLTKNNFVLVTVHRDSNTDDADNLNNLVSSFIEIAEEEKIPFILPLHPRTKKMFSHNLRRKYSKAIDSNPLIKVVEPVSFLDMIMLEANCKMVMTDSGGVQKESYFFQKPCIILRNETEWVELVKNGTALLCGARKTKIKNAYQKFKLSNDLSFPEIFGDGKAAEFICEQVILNFKR